MYGHVINVPTYSNVKLPPIPADTRLTRTLPVIIGCIGPIPDIMHSANKCNVFGGSFNQKALARTLTCDRYNSLKRPFVRLVSSEQYFTSSRVMNYVIAACGQPIHWLRSFYDLFFLWFRLCWGETGLLVTPKYDYVRNLFTLVPVVGLFSSLFFLLCLSHISLHTVIPS